MNENNPDIKVDAWVVKFNDTQYYNIAPEDRPYIKSISQVYLYDRNERTFCCEITPSYYLDPLYVNIEFTLDTPDDIRDSLDQKYAYEPTDPTYMHCHTVDKVSTKVRVGEFESMDHAREEAQANHYI